MAHIHVVENEVGCLPEAESACFAARAGAEGYAQDLADELRETGYRVTGTKRDGYRAVRGQLGARRGADRHARPAVPRRDLSDA